MTSVSENGRLAGASTGAGRAQRRSGLRLPGTRMAVLRRLLFVVDGAALAAAWSIAMLLQPFRQEGRPAATSLALLAGTVVGGLFVLRALHLYRARVSAIRTEEISRLARGSALIAIGVAVAGLAADISLNATEAVSGGLLSMLALLTARSGYRGWVTAQRQRGRFTRPILIVGADEEAAEIRRLMRDHPELGHDVKGVVGDRHEAVGAGLTDLHLGPVERVVDLVEETGVSGVIIATTSVPADDLNPVIRTLIGRGIHVHLTTGLRRVDHRRLRVQPLAHEPFFYVEPPAASLNRGQAALKRGLDLAIGTLVSVAMLPMAALIAVLVKREDEGPVLFKQTRVGRDGELFTMYKFRTMVTDAEARLTELRAANQRSGPLFKLNEDPRITRLGRFLRASSLDELPQLWNVLCGSMSLVGPRPALPEEVADFDDDLRSRTEVKPGMTGLWQVEARDNPSFDAYRRLDLMYVENWSITFDLVILLSTVETVLIRSFKCLTAALRGSGEATEMVGPAREAEGGVLLLDEDDAVAGSDGEAKADPRPRRPDPLSSGVGA